MNKTYQDRTNEILDILKEMKPIERKIAIVFVLDNFCFNCGRIHIHRGCSCEISDQA